jgi:hypothetical protein
MAAKLFSPARRSSDRERLAMLPQLENGLGEQRYSGYR